MILAVDVGNTNIVLGCIEKGEILNIVRIQTSDRETAAEYAIKLKQVLEFYQVDCKGFEGAIISSVVPPVTEALRQAIFLITGVKAVVVGPGMKTGMNIRLDDPSTLAGDLVAGSVAAMSYYGAPVIVIDMGTATTMVVVDRLGPPPVIVYTMSNICSEPMMRVISRNQNDGIMPGSVTEKNWRIFPAPSMAEASKRESGIFWMAETRMMAEMPKVFQMATNTTT